MQLNQQVAVAAVNVVVNAAAAVAVSAVANADVSVDVVAADSRRRMPMADPDYMD